MVAAPIFVLGLIGSLFAREANVAERLMVAAMPAAMAFLAALMLSARDRARHMRTVRKVRAKLLARDAVSDDEFLRSFASNDPALLQQTRRAIAQFFDVPVEKIRATDTLDGDFNTGVLEPGFHFFVVHHVLNARKIEPRAFQFRTGKLINDIGGFVAEIQRVLDGKAPDNDAGRHP